MVIWLQAEFKMKTDEFPFLRQAAKKVLLKAQYLKAKPKHSLQEECGTIVEENGEEKLRSAHEKKTFSIFHAFLLIKDVFLSQHKTHL